MRCQHCKENIPDDSAYCPICGEPIGESTVNDSNVKSVSEDNFQSYNQPSSTINPNLTPTPQNNYPNNQGNTIYPNQNQGYSASNTGIPAGYTYDSRSGQYYTSAYVLDPQTRRQVQQVTYYNPQTGLYNTVNYPVQQQTSPQYQQYQPYPLYQQYQQPEKKVWPVVLTVCLVAFFVIVVIVALFESFSTEYNDILNSSSSYGDTSEYSSDDSYGYNEGRDSSLEDSDIKPLFSNESGNSKYSVEYPHSSNFVTRVVEDGNYVYFLSNYTYDESQYLFRYNSKDKTTETIIDAGYGYFISNFAITEDSIVFSIGESSDYDAGGSISYFKADKNTFEYEHFFDEVNSNITVHNGYIYLLDDYYEELVKVGLNNNGDVVSKGYELGLEDSVYLSSNPVSIIDDQFYIYAYDDNNTDIIYRYTLDAMNRFLVFRGETNYLYDNLFIHDDRVFYAKYDISENENYDVVIGSSKLGEIGSEIVYYTYKNEFDFPEQDIFAGRNENNFYYSTKDGLVKTTLADPTTVVDTLSTNDLPKGITESWIVNPDEIISTEDFSTYSLETDTSESKITVDSYLVNNTSENSSSSTDDTSSSLYSDYFN